MKEGIDPELQATWNRKLSQAGMPEELEPTAVPVVPAGRFSNIEVSDIEDPELAEALSLFESFLSEIQDDIITDLKKHRDLKMPSREILDRFKVLVAKGQELASMSPDDSDREHNPRSIRQRREEKERANIEEGVSRTVDKLIRDIEKIRHRDNSKPKGVDKYKN